MKTRKEIRSNFLCQQLKYRVINASVDVNVCLFRDYFAII